MRAILGLGFLLSVAPVAAQSGTILGTVRDEGGDPVPRVAIRLRATEFRATTDGAGRFQLNRVPDGDWVLEMRALGFAPIDRAVTVAGDPLILQLRLERRVFDLGAIIVEGASRAPEEVLETPVAVGVASRDALVAATLSGETPRALRQVPGVDVVQSDLFDYNVNARGFNSTLNRSVLVLVDGRDIAVPFLGSQEWAAVTFAPEDLEQMEFIRGPGSALYGANAFNGVVNITTPPVREALGTRVTIGAGDRETFRADMRHGGQLPGGTLAYRVSGGYQRSLGFSTSRTRYDAGDFAAEYAPATPDPVEPPPPGFEQLPLNGQTADPSTGTASGDVAPVVNYYGAGRLDWHRASGVMTFDAGMAHVENELFMTGIGRFQVDGARRPWARVRWESEQFTMSGWYSGRIALEPQRLLTSGQPVDDHSAIWQAETQFTSALGPEVTMILGGSARWQMVNTNQTLMAAADDDRTDGYYAAFGQLDWRLTDRVRLLAAGRVDAGNLFDAQFSPRGALIWRVGAEHALRMTASRAFLTPSQIEYFLSGTATVQDLSPLENGLRGSPLGPALAPVPPGTLFTNSSAVPILVRGNRNLQPEDVLSFELGYKGRPATPLFVTVDLFFSRRDNFVTSLLPAVSVNPDYPAWTAPPEVGLGTAGVIEGAVRSALQGTLAQFGLTRLADGSTAIVLSYGNAGLAEDYGVESGASLWLARTMRVDGSATLYRSDIKQQATGDTLVPNTPGFKGTFGVTYQGVNGIDLGVQWRGQGSFEWRSGLYRGRVPAYATVDMHAGWQVTPLLRVHGVAMNVLNDRHFEAYGGAVTGRRVLGGVTATF